MVWTVGNLSQHRPNAARKLAAVIVSQKRGTKAPMTGLRSGRIDRTRVARLGSRDLRVFHAAHSPSPQRVRVIILLDASGSMAGHEATITVQLARDFADAFVSLRGMVTGEVWAHTTGYDRSGGHTIDIAPIWKSGMPTSAVDTYLTLGFSGNEDGWALAAMGDRLAETIQPGETGIIIVVSDGAPAYTVAPAAGSGHGYAKDIYGHVRMIANQIRKRDCAVISVSVSRSLNVSTQSGMYGMDSVVPYDTNMSVTARKIGLAIGKQLNK